MLVCKNQNFKVFSNNSSQTHSQRGGATLSPHKKVLPKGPFLATKWFKNCVFVG